MTIAETIRQAGEITGGGETGVLGIEVLLAFCFGRGREYLILNSDKEVPASVDDKFRGLLGRFYLGEPVAYLTNSKEFYGLDFYVDKNVLIPRPETELLVEKAIEYAKGRDGKVKIADVGTGSGCIAVSLAKNIQNAMLTATDISGSALEIAKRNAEKNGVKDRIDFVETDLLENIAGPYDIIVANLPYIGNRKFNLVSREAYDYEPHVALFGGENGLKLYENLFEQVMSLSWKPRVLLGEFGFLQGEEIRGLLNKYFVQQRWHIEQDLASIERIFMVEF